MKKYLLWNVKLNTLVLHQKVLSLVLMLFSILVFAEAKYVYHEVTTNFVNGVSGIQYRNNLIPNSSEATTISFKVENQFDTNQLRVYYTIDGSLPAGVFGVGTGTTMVVSGSYINTFAYGGSNIDVVSAIIPAQTPGTVVTYIVSAWHSGGGDEIFGNGPGSSCGCGSVTNNSTLATTFSYTVPAAYIWNGSVDTTWANPANWSPYGVPAATDNVIINVPGTNQLNIAASRTINNFTLNGNGTFSAASTGSLTINGDFNYGGSATATLDCESQFNIASSTSQPVPPLTYGNLNIMGGPRVLSPTGTIQICAEFIANSDPLVNTVTNSTVEYISNTPTVRELRNFTYNNLNFSGSGFFTIGFNSWPSVKVINVLGNFLQSAGTVYLGDHAWNTGVATLNIDGDMTVSGGFFNVNKVSTLTTYGGNGIVNLKGDLTVSALALFEATYIVRTLAESDINFVGTGDGSTAALTQTINIANQTTAAKITFNVNSGAYVRLINQDLALGTSSAFNVKTGGMFDFGFNGTTALNIVPVASQISQTFATQQASTLKITSPNGITNTANLGNVQTGAAGRTYHADATFYYIGKGDQASGNGLPNAGSAKKVIVELDQNSYVFQPNGVNRIISPGYLEIRAGIVLDNSTGGFDNVNASPLTSGDLIMSGGRYRLFKTGAQPGLTGVYNLTAGVVEFASSQAGSQNIRSESYQNIEVTGNNVGKTGNDITLKNNGTFTIKPGGVFKISSNAIVGPVGSQTVTVENNGTFETGDQHGFSGTSQTSIDVGIETINLQNGSTVGYSRGGNQVITNQIGIGQGADGNYYNLKISNSGIKTAPSKTVVKNITSVVDAAELLVPPTGNNVLPNEFHALNGVQVDALATFRLANNANLFQDATASNTGNVIAERNVIFSAGRQQYNYLSSPVKNLNLKDIYKDGSGNAVTVPFVLYHNEATNKFYNSSGAYIAGRALAVKEATSTDFSGSPMKASFTGEPMNGSFNYTLVNSNTSDTNRGYNLIGNPYPSNLDLDAFYGANSTDLSPTFYFWDNKANTRTAQEGDLYGGQAYAQFNAATPPGTGSGTVATGDAGAGTKVPTRYVKIGQGFMARTLVASKTVAFTNAIRSAGLSVGFFGKNTVPFDRYWLKMKSPTNITSQIAIVYFAGGNNGYTKDDSQSLGGSDAIYSTVENEKISINGKDAFSNTDVVPLGSNHFSTGNYTIALDEEKNGIFANGQNIYLKDKHTGILTNLSEGEYQFTANEGENSGRFEIVYVPEIYLATNNTTENLIIYKDGSDFIIKAKSKKITEVEVYDSSGRMINKIKPNSTIVVINSEKLNNGIYILKVNQGGEITTKKVIK